MFVVRASFVRMFITMISFLSYVVCLIVLYVFWSSYVACFLMLYLVVGLSSFLLIVSSVYCMLSAVRNLSSELESW